MTDKENGNNKDKIKSLKDKRKEKKELTELQKNIENIKKNYKDNIEMITLVTGLYVHRFNSFIEMGMTRNEVLSIIIERGLE